MKKIKLQNEPRLDAKLNSFSYQEEAVEFAKDLEYAAIFHEQGLGKTKIALDIALFWLENTDIDTVLIVTKKGLIKNWEDECKFHSYLHPKTLTSNKNSNYYVFNSTTRLVVTNYETISGEKKRLKLFLKARNVAAILDESAKIKNPNSVIAKDLFELSDMFERRIIMTGTPIANRPYDIWAQIYFLDKGNSLGTDYKDFKKKADLTKDLEKNTQKRVEFEEFIAEINNKINAFSIRETKKTASISLPEKNYINCWTLFTPKQKDLYDKLKKELKIEIQQDGVKEIDDASPVLKRILRLVQITSNPKMLDESFDCISGKEKELRFLVKDIVSRGEKVIVWTNYVYNIHYFEKLLSTYKPVVLYGGMNIEERNKSVETFKKGSAEVLIATPQAAKEGLTLTVANNAIFYDRSFSLDDYLQAQDRIHRISQKKECNIYNIMIRGSIDEWIHELLLSKEQAAALTQSDIDKASYSMKADYSYNAIIERILNEGEQE